MILQPSSEFQEVLAHFPTKISSEADEYATEHALKSSRYLFLQRIKGVQHAYCTYCKNTSEVNGLKESKISQCPSCDSDCVVKQSGRSRKYLKDEVYFEWFQKSNVNSEAIIAMAIYVSRDYSGDYQEVKNEYSVKALYVFEMGKSIMLEKSCWRSKEYDLKKSQYSVAPNGFSNMRGYFPTHCIEKAVKGTPFQYSMWESYTKYELIKFLSLYSQYPSIEYLTKFGMQDIVERKLTGLRTFNAINWRGKDLNKLTKLDKGELKIILKNNLKFTAPILWLYKEFKKDGVKVDLVDFYNWAIKVSVESREEEIKFLRQFTTLKKIMSYSIKQYEKNTERGYYSVGHVLSMWKDYLLECNQLEMDTQLESVFYPTNLRAAHQRNIDRIKLTADRKKTALIKKQAKELSDYSFEFGGFILRPVTSSAEMIREGNILRTCVGNYTDRYAHGETGIFVIRRTKEPNQPFYTMEIKNNQIKQVYGEKNSIPTEELVQFLHVFKSVKIEKNVSNSVAV
jgi:hypothetical protein